MADFSRAVHVEMEWVNETSFEIRGTLDDNVHSLTARLLVSFPDYIIREASSRITRMPYQGYCQAAYHAMSRFVGEKIGRGFRKRTAEIIGGAESCNHLHTLVTNMSACAFQMNYLAAKQKPEAAAEIERTSGDIAGRRLMVMGWMPQLRNSCFVFSEAADGLFEKPEQAEAGKATEE